jgi:hypothetical protein
MPLASSALLPSVTGTLPATHVVSSHSFILVGTDLKHWKISIKKILRKMYRFSAEAVTHFGAQLEVVRAQHFELENLRAGP